MAHRSARSYERDGGPQWPISATARMLRGKRFRLFLMIYLVEVVLLFGALAIPLSSEMQSSLLSQGQQIVNSATQGTPADVVFNIFENNAIIALTEAIPVVGAARFALSIYGTGQVLQAFANSQNIQPMLFGGITFLLPHTLVELSAYPVAVAAGTMLIWGAIKREFRHELKVFVAELAVVGLILLAGAGIEAAEVLDSSIGFLMWIPVAGAIVALARLRNRA